MSTIKVILKYLLAFGFVLAGTNHFINPAFYMKMMPRYLPAHLFLIYLSGFFEILLGALLLTPRFARQAAWGIIGLLIAVFPANVFMAMNTELFPEYNPAQIWLRLPLQIILIAWAFWYAKPDHAK